MAKSPAPAPENVAQPMPAGAQPEGWTPPTSDQEFKFESTATAPAWVDKGWASFDRGPALAIPAGNLDGTGPYHTMLARIGDTVKFIAATDTAPAHFEVVAADEPAAPAAEPEA